jgi:hypothetical protein
MAPVSTGSDLAGMILLPAARSSQIDCGALFAPIRIARLARFLIKLRRYETRAH